MARTRYLKPDFFTDYHIGRLPPLARLLYEGLWCYADANGVVKYEPELKLKILPYDDCDMEGLLKLLCSPKEADGEPFVRAYQVDARKYLQVVRFHEHQKVHSNEEARYPEPPEKKSGTLPSTSEALGLNLNLNSNLNLNLNGGSASSSTTAERADGSSSEKAEPESKPTRAPSKNFWWDAEKHRVWGKAEAREKLRTKWLARGLSPEEFQSQLRQLDRWLEDRPGKRQAGTNFANRINNWLNKAVSFREERESI